MTYISQSHTWADPTASTEDVITAVKLNGNNDDFIDGLKDGTKDINCNQITAALTGNSSTSTTITSRNLNLKLWILRQLLLQPPYTMNFLGTLTILFTCVCKISKPSFMI